MIEMVRDAIGPCGNQGAQPTVHIKCPPVLGKPFQDDEIPDGVSGEIVHRDFTIYIYVNESLPHPSLITSWE